MRLKSAVAKHFTDEMLRSSSLTAMVCASLVSTLMSLARDHHSTRGHLLIVTKDRRPLVRRSPIRECPRNPRDAEE